MRCIQLPNCLRLVRMIVILLATTISLPVWAAQPDPVFQVQVSSSSPGSEAVAVLRIAATDSVTGFNLLLELPQPISLAATADDFQRNGEILPTVSLGSHELNVVRNAGPNRIRIIGLAPGADGGTIGTLTVHIDKDAPVGARYPITLIGEVDLKDEGVVQIEPVVAMITIVEPGQTGPLYLPVIQAR